MTLPFTFRQGFSKPAATTDDLVLPAIAFCWLAAKIIGWKVWVADRTFPLVAPFSCFDNTPPLVHRVLFGLSVVLLLSLVIKPANHYLKIVLLFTELSSCLLDQTRWQPWEYLYLFILLIFIINRHRHSVIYGCLLFTLATVYVYSGVHKVNEGFIVHIWQNMILRRFFKMPYSLAHAGWMHYTGYLLPLLESLGGAGLLFAKTKKTAAASLIAMHLFILLLIGPIGLHYNKIVWPWNLAMLLMLYLLLFQDKQSASAKWIEFGRPNKWLLLSWAILPALNFAGLWDNYLSWSLYSSRPPAMDICIKDTSATTPLRRYYSNNDTAHICNGSVLLNLQRWAMMDMNVPPYPEVRVYKKIEMQWNKTYPLAHADFLIYYFPFKPASSPVKSNSN